jgi:hypothetical protein
MGLRARRARGWDTAAVQEPLSSLLLSFSLGCADIRTHPCALQGCFWSFALLPERSIRQIRLAARQPLTWPVRSPSPALSPADRSDPRRRPQPGTGCDASPAGVDWDNILGWLVQKALSGYAPDALRRPLPALPRSRLTHRRRAGCPAGRGGAGHASPTGSSSPTTSTGCTHPKEQQTSTPAPGWSPRCPLRPSARWSYSTGGAPRIGPRSALQCSAPAHPRPLRPRSRWQLRPSQPRRPAGGRDGGLAGRTSNSLAIQARTHQPAPGEKEYLSR